MNLQNKLCVVTGANSGIGKATALKMAQKEAYVIMICRNEERAQSAKVDIINKTGNTGVEILIADLQHQYDVRRAAKEIKSRFDRVDLLINNAGIFPSERRETPEGIERTFAINYLGHFMLTYLLLDHLETSKEARVINITSDTHKMAAPWFDMQHLMLQEGFTPFRAYAQSKLCNIMFTRELARRTADSSIKTYALHPGMVSTNLPSEAGWLLKLSYFLGSPFMKSPNRAAESVCYLAAAEEISEKNGAYFKNKKPSSPASVALDNDKTRKLWELSKRLCHLD